MSTVNITQAAKLAGISRSYFHRKYVKTGEISITSDKAGNKQIDTSELLRVFGELQGLPVHSEHDTPSTHEVHTVRKEELALLAENEALKAKLAAIESQVEELRDDKEWFKQQIAEEKLRAERAEIKLLEHLAPDQAEQSVPPDTETKALLEELARPNLWWQFWK